MNILDTFEPEKLDMKDVKNEEDIEKQLELEAKKLLKAKQQSQMHDMRDAQYYACVVFGNKHDKDVFLSALKNIDIEGETFIDGYQLAKAMGIEVKITASLPEPHYVKQLKLKKDGIRISRKK